MLNTYNFDSFKNYKGVNTENFKIYINNIKTFKNHNIDTFLYSIVNNNTLVIKGSYYIRENQVLVVGTELVKVISYRTGKIDNVNITELVVERAYDGTPMTNLLVGDIVCTVDDFTLKTVSYNYSNKMDLQNNPFQVYYGNGLVRIVDDIKRWNVFSKKQNKYNYSLYKTKVFIFEGYENNCILTFRGYLKKLSFSKSINDRRYINFNLVDQLGQYWNKDLKIKKFRKDISIDSYLSELFEIPKEKIYYKHIDKSKYPLIDSLVIGDKKTYQEVVELLSSNGIRFFFTPRGHIHIFSEVVDNHTLVTDTVLDDVSSLIDISLSDDSQLIYNSGKIEYKRQFPYYDVEKSINYLYKIRVSLEPIIIFTEGNYITKEFNVTDEHLASRVSLDVYGKPSVCLLKDVLTGFEIICNPLNIENNTVTFVPLEILSDTGLLEFGKGKFLVDTLGLSNIREWDLHYVQGNLPTVFALSRTEASNESAKTNNLTVPITPIIMDNGVEFINLNKEYDLSFGSPANLKDLEYTGEYDDIDSIVGEFVGGNHLLYEREWEQSQNGINVFVNATSLRNRELSRLGLPVYDTFDNSGFNLKITNKDASSRSNITARFINTHTRELNLRDLKKVSFVKGDIIGDLALVKNDKTRALDLAPNDVLFPVRVLEGASGHEKLKFKEMNSRGIEIRCTSKTIMGTEVVYTFNNPLFMNIEYAKIPLENIVYLQNFYIKLNPIVASKHIFYYSNQESVEIYDGKKEFSLPTTIFNEEFTKKLLSYVFTAYNGTSLETSKYIIPISTLKSIEYELYDLIKIEDNTVTDIGVNNLFLIVGKSVNFEKGRKIEYTLLNIYSNEVSLLDLKYTQVEKYNPLVDTTYNHSKIEYDTTTYENYNKRIELIDNRIGRVSANLINPEKFRFFTSEDSKMPLLEVELRGSMKKEYIKSLFPLDTLYQSYMIIKIGNEYLYVSAFRTRR